MTHSCEPINHHGNRTRVTFPAELVSGELAHSQLHPQTNTCADKRTLETTMTMAVEQASSPRKGFFCFLAQLMA